MKRHAHLFDQIVDYENLHTAFGNARKAKRQKNPRLIAHIERNFDQLAAQLIRDLQAGAWRNGDYTRFILRERGKEREIFRLPFWPDRVLHHAICQVLVPIWRPTLILDTSASIKGRGVHFTAKRVREWVRTDPEGTRFCLQIDVRKFYPSINHDILMAVLARKIKDTQCLALLGEIVRSIDVTAPGVGVPIGNYLSQWFANLYLSELDHWVTAEPKTAHYHRYCDDVVVFSGDKAYLHDLRVRITDWLARERRLDVKKNWQVFQLSTDRPLNFCGYLFRPEKTLIRKETKKRMIRSLGRKDHTPEQRLAVRGAYNGWLSFGSCHTLRNRFLKEHHAV